MKTKFALRNFKGNPTAYYLVESEDVERQAATAVKLPAHHLAVLDVSGSMWGDLDTVKSMVEKVFTAQEFNDPSQRITLISYSSNGDCRVHFTRVTVADVLAPNSPHLMEIRNLQTRGLTGISQALKTAEKLIDDQEITGISLHSDGYANDPSPYTESQQLQAMAKSIAGHPNVFCNTVAYRSSCDFALLSAVANQLSGKCIQAKSAKEVYEALAESQKLLSGQVSPVIEAGLGDFNFVTFVSKSAGKVLGGTETLKVRGLAPKDDKTVYRYLRVTEQVYNATDIPVVGETVSDDALLAFCRVNIALGNLNVAKYAMVTTRNLELFPQHARALVSTEIAAMSADVEKFLFASPIKFRLQTEYGLGATGPSVLSVLKVLTSFKGSLRAHMPTLLAGYKRRGLKRVPGTRDASGALVKPLFDTKVKGAEEWVAVSGIEMNRDTATANIRFVQDVDLVDASGKVLPEVAGVKLDLKDYKNYTVVSDGQINIPMLPLRTSDKRCFAALKALGAVQGEFSPTAQMDINLATLPLVDYDQTFSNVPADAFTKILKLTVLQKILSGLTKEVSEAFTAEQVAELKKHHLSPALYFSPPTTNTYSDLSDAIAKGHVDTRLSYKIKVGNSVIRSLGDLYSGNAYLQRRFVFTGADGKVVDKPTLSMWWAQGGTWSLKTLSSKTKLDEIDALTHPIYAEFFGLEKNGALVEAMTLAGVDAGKQQEVLGAGKLAPEAAVQVFGLLSRQVDESIEGVYAEHIMPLAFFVGATGLVPDAYGATAMTPEQFTAKYASAKLSKDEREATFYELPGGLLLTVFVFGEHFTTESGLKV